MNLTTRDRIERGLDRDGLIAVHNRLDETTNYTRGLIYIEAKKDQQENSSLSWLNYLNGFIVDGKQISPDWANKLSKATEMQEELTLENIKKLDTQVSSFLNETEAELRLPDSPSVITKLTGSSAIDKARNYKAIQEATGKDSPSATDIYTYNTAKKEAKEKLNEFAKKNTLPKPVPKSDPFTFDEEVDFETWCIEEHNFDVVASRPKNTRAIYALKDENVTNLFGRLDEWKTAYKIMAKLCHPDTGGNSLAMSFLGEFKGLMTSLQGIKEVIDYEEKIKLLKQEYSTPKLK